MRMRSVKHVADCLWTGVTCSMAIPGHDGSDTGVPLTFCLTLSVSRLSIPVQRQSYRAVYVKLSGSMTEMTDMTDMTMFNSQSSAVLVDITLAETIFA